MVGIRILFLFILLCFFGLVYLYAKFNKPKIVEGFSEFPCRTILTDTQWVENMIKHHQMGLDMSIHYLPEARSPVLANVIRGLIRAHDFEIFLMKAHLKNPFKNVSHIEFINEPYRPGVVSGLFPNKVGLSDVFCDPNYFMPAGHSGMHMVHSDLQYIQHMIPHHIVAIDMSKILLRHTKSDFLIDLCNRIITNQEFENIHLNGLAYQ
jgi:hypothetical protein